MAQEIAPGALPTLACTGPVRGRVFDERGRCNTAAKPLSATVRAIEPGRLWNIHVAFQKDSRAHVDVLFDLDVVHNLTREGALFASGLLFGESASEHLMDDHGRGLYSSYDNKPIMRAPIVISGPFEGARYEDRGWETIVRVDAIALLPFYLEIPIRLC